MLSEFSESNYVASPEGVRVGHPNVAILDEIAIFTRENRLGAGKLTGEKKF